MKVKEIYFLEGWSSPIYLLESGDIKFPVEVNGVSMWLTKREALKSKDLKIGPEIEEAIEYISIHCPADMTQKINK